MPFRPAQSGGGLEQIFQLFQLKESMQAQERQKQQDALALTMRMVEAGGDPTPLLPSVLPELQGPIQQLYQQRIAEKQRQAYEGATDPQTINALIPNVAGTIDPSGNLQQVDTAEQERALGLLEQDFIRRGGNPRDSGLVRERALLGARGVEREGQQKVAYDKFQTGQQMRAASHSSGLARSNQAHAAGLQRAENERREALQKEDQFVQDAAQRLAAVSTGAAPPQEATAVAEDIAKQYGAHAPQVAQRVTSLARAGAYDYSMQLRKTEGADSANTKAISEALEIPERDVRVWRAGAGELDPLTNQVAVGKFGKGWPESRLALGQSQDLLRDLEDTFGRLRKEALTDPLSGGPITGSEAAGAFARSLGIQGSVAGEYEAKYRNYALAAARAAQGARASDMDLRFILMQIPTREEVFSGSAQGRFKALRDIQNIQVQAPFNRGIAQNIAAAKQGDVGLTDARQLMKLLEDGNFEEFNAGLQTFKARYGGRFQLPGIGADATNPGNGFADDFFDAHLGGP